MILRVALRIRLPRGKALYVEREAGQEGERAGYQPMAQSRHGSVKRAKIQGQTHLGRAECNLKMPRQNAFGNLRYSNRRSERAESSHASPTTVHARLCFEATFLEESVKHLIEPVACYELDRSSLKSGSKPAKL